MLQQQTQMHAKLEMFMQAQGDQQSQQLAALEKRLRVELRDMEDRLVRKLRDIVDETVERRLRERLTDLVRAGRPHE